MKSHRRDNHAIFEIHAPFAPLLEKFFGLRSCAAIYDDLVAHPDDCDFSAQILERMGMSYVVTDEEFGRIPATGSLVVIANHPFGGAEGLILLDLLRRARPDVRVLANSLLCRIPELRETVIPVDPFDEHYTHLFIWNRDALEIVGAYRLGKTDEILRNLGKKGLYTQTLFHFRTRMLEGLGPALEMGRSFVREEYQRGYAPLLLLWKGIGRFVSEHPRYRMLFGPVSISREYSDVSRRLMVETLQESLSLPELARMVKPRIPMRVKRVLIKGCAPETARAVMRDIEELSALIADIEIDQKGIPVLLRHYLNLGGKLLAFNLDPEFGEVLDGLVLVDLLRTDRRTLARYMGKDEAEAFRAYHENLATTRLAC